MARTLQHVLAGRRAERLIREWGIKTLPIDLEAIAEQHGIVVKAMPDAVTGVSGILRRAGEIFGIAYATWIDNPDLLCAAALV